eukprot:COSAG03_NODE_17691_length_370_cov_0.745387_1_plen_47_part_10
MHVCGLTCWEQHINTSAGTTVRPANEFTLDNGKGSLRQLAAGAGRGG